MQCISHFFKNEGWFLKTNAVNDFERVSVLSFRVSNPILYFVSLQNW